MKSKRSDPRPARSRKQPPFSAVVFREAIPSSIAAVEPFVTRFVDRLGQVGCLDGQREAIEIALREALANAIVHGNRRDERKTVQVECRRKPDASIVLTVRDQGAGFDPNQLADPTRPENILRSGGRGIYIIRRFVDQVQFRRGGREICMCKKP